MMSTKYYICIWSNQIYLFLYYLFQVCEVRQWASQEHRWFPRPQCNLLWINWLIQNRRLFDLYHQLVTGKVEKNLPQQSTKAKATKPISILPKAQSRLKIIFKISTILQLKILDQTLPQNLDINSVPTSRQHFSFIVWTTNLLQNLEKTPPLMYWHISRLNSLPNIRLKYRPSCRQNIPYHQHQETSITEKEASQQKIVLQLFGLWFMTYFWTRTRRSVR